MQIEALQSLAFARPWALLLLPVAGLCCWLLYRQVNQRSVWDKLLPAPIRLALLQRQAGGKHAGRFLFLAGAWLTGILALAGPVLDSPLPATQTNQSALVIVWDVSRNMLATDLQPNRLERARLKIRDLMQLHSDSQLALIAYAGTAHPVTPLSSDMQTLTNLLVALQPSVMPEDGQNLEAGLQLARQMIADLPPANSRVLVITSGVEGAQLDALRQQARDLGDRLSILGVGTTEGSPVPLLEGGFMRDAQGGILLPRLNSKSLSAIARSTGARYQQIRLGDQDLISLVPTNQSLAETEQAAGLSRIDQGHWLILLLLPLAAMGARRGWLGLVLCAALLPLPADASVWQDLWQRPDQQAMQQLQRQQPAAAAERFEDPHWRAWAYYQAGDYPAAVKAYEALLSAQPDNPEHHFNHGTALAMAGEYQAALEAYEQTLTRAPEHQPARHNRERIEALLKELAKQQEQAQEQASDEPEDSDEDSGSATDSSNRSRTEDDDSNANPKAPTDSQEDAPGTSEQAAAARKDDTSGDGGDGEAKGDDPAAEANANADKPVTDNPPGGSDADDSSARTRNNEQQAALQQWLQDIPDDPAELLKRKFLYQRLQQLEDLSQ
ncbi:VWA domain-containing protein [Halopseudomonas laoshanensis]|uniref:VWA domain-containing protein n=1 Tax=Halopseudomonas laoshanensis TaxID=2268758 RepID=UPI00373571B3